MKKKNIPSLPKETVSIPSLPKLTEARQTALKQYKNQRDRITKIARKTGALPPTLPTVRGLAEVSTQNVKKLTKQLQTYTAKQVRQTGFPSAPVVTGKAMAQSEKRPVDGWYKERKKKDEEEKKKLKSIEGQGVLRDDFSAGEIVYQNLLHIIDTATYKNRASRLYKILDEEVSENRERALQNMAESSEELVQYANRICFDSATEAEVQGDLMVITVILRGTIISDEESKAVSDEMNDTDNFINSGDFEKDNPFPFE